MSPPNSSSVSSWGCVLLSWLLRDDLHHLGFDRFLLKSQSVLVPNELRGLWINAILFHAPLEQTDDVTIVGILCKTEAFTVMHELLELIWLVSAELIDCDLLLLLFNVGILLSL